MSISDNLNDTFEAVGEDVGALRDWRATFADVPVAFAQAWEGNFSPRVSYEGEVFSIDGPRIDTDDTTYKPLGTMSVSVDGNGAVPGNPSIPVGLYIQHEQVGTNPANNMYSHSIMAYARNAAAGDNDVIAVSGRVSREQVVGGIGDAAGIWGSVYNRSTNNGGSMALEGHSYQVVSGMGAADDYNGGYWSTGLHIRCSGAPTGSPTLAGILIGGNSSGTNYSAWNGITITPGTFQHLADNAGVSGTVGLNMGAWTSSAHAEIAVKFGYADGDDSWHLYRGNAGVHVGANLLNVTNPGASGAAGIRVESKGSSNSYIDLQNEGSIKGSMFWDSVADDIKLNAVGDLVIRRNNSDRIRTTGQGATLTGAAGGPTGLRVNSAATYNSYIDLFEGGVSKAQLFWDNAGDRFIVGTTVNAKFDFRTNSTLAFRINEDQTAKFYNELNVFDTVYTQYNGTDHADIAGLVGGTSGGTLIQGVSNRHVVVALKDNDTNDTFSVVTGGGNYMSDTTYDTLAFTVDALGNGTFAGSLATNAIRTSGEGLVVSRGDGADVTSNYATLISNDVSGNTLTFESDAYQWKSHDGGTLFGGFDPAGLLYTRGTSSTNGFRIENSTDRVDMFFDGDTADTGFVISYNGSGAYDIVLTHATTNANIMNGLWNFAGGSILVNNTQVIGTQQAAIADATTGDTGLQTAINAALAAMRAHGLIAT